MLTPAIDLTRVIWEARHKDGSIIRKGPQQYQKINRSNLEAIDVYFEGKSMLTFGCKGRTFFWRLRNAKPIEMTSDGGVRELPVRRLAIILGLIKKNLITEKNTKVVVMKLTPNGEVIDQTYEYDPEESKFYFIFENGKIEIRNTFSEIPPYDKVKLREEELAQLNGSISS